MTYKSFRIGFMFLLLFVLSVCSVAVAGLTVDYNAATTTMRAVADMHINPLIDHFLLGGIMIMQLLKYFFPKIDGGR